MKLENINKSRIVRIILITICAIIVLLGILQIGITIGEEKVRYTGQFGNYFENNFMGQMRGPMEFFDNDLPGGHGVVGKIISMSSTEIVISGQDNIEKIVSITDKTIFRKFKDDVTASDLKIGDFVVVIGNPDSQGKVEAKLLRVMPAPKTDSDSVSNNIDPQN